MTQICQKAMVSCELLAHPRSSTLDLELPMDGDEILSMKRELMKVHVVYIDNGVSGADTFVAQNDDNDDEDDEQAVTQSENEVIQSGAERSGTDFSSEPGFDFLAGKVKGWFAFPSAIQFLKFSIPIASATGLSMSLKQSSA